MQETFTTSQDYVLLTKVLDLSGEILCLPDGLWHLQPVRVGGRECCQAGASRDSLLKADVLGVGGEVRRLVDVLDGDGDSRCGLERGLDAAGQVGLVGDHHRQHEGTVHLIVHRLQVMRGKRQ